MQLTNFVANLDLFCYDVGLNYQSNRPNISPVLLPFQCNAQRWTNYARNLSIAKKTFHVCISFYYNATL